MAQSEFILLVDDGPELPSEPLSRWKVAVIDDDLAVHSGTRFALQDYQLNGRRIELLPAHSAREGRELLKANPDIAVVLLDVVMEHDSAGLELVEYIRNDLKNEVCRIILRTGQPGQAPERRVIVDYDINDYKAKTELTADKLFTAMTAALRSYEQLKRLTETRRGLEIIVEAASDVFETGSLQKFSEGVLTQLSSLIDADCAGMLVLREESDNSDFRVLAGSGTYRDFASIERRSTITRDLGQLIERAFTDRKHSFLDGRSLLYLRTASGREIVVLLDASKHLSDTDRALVEVFCSRLAIAFDNVSLYDQLQEANANLEQRVQMRTKELSAANDRLELQWSRLRTAATFKSEVLGTVAHDLKNPLAVVLGRTEMLSEFLSISPLPKEQADQQIGHIRTAVNRLLAMIDSLIGDAMKDADDIALRHDRFDLSRLVAETVEANRTLAERKEQEISLSAPPALPAFGDSDRLREAIDNLLSNAVKYSPLRGAIQIEVMGDHDAAVVSVSDSGPGLSPEDEGRLFGRFQRLSAKPTAGESSTGLGLSIVKRIADLHGGAILVDKGPLGGARFTLSLPNRRAHEPQSNS
jgi:signal transduction histidine kinase/CheY-like chemotaxis protein